MTDERPQLDPRLTPYVGRPADGPVKCDVLDNFEACPACGQLIDRRDLAAVTYHSQGDHTRLAEPDATRLVGIGDRLRVALLQGTVDRRVN